MVIFEPLFSLFTVRASASHCMRSCRTSPFRPTPFVDVCAVWKCARPQTQYPICSAYTHPRCACMHANGDSCRIRYDYHIRPCMI